MQWEYLIYNAIIISGPLALSFDKKVNFIKKWPQTLLASLMTLVPFIIWDIIVTGRHWWFNEAYTLPFRFLGLPIAEWLFFITVPFSCIFIWEVLKAYFSNNIFDVTSRLYWLAVLFALVGSILFFSRLEYTGLVFITSSVVLVMDRISGVKILLMSRTYVQLLIVTMLILVFNGYLTARPVVLYDAAYQLDIRIITIPVEDFLYGFSHILLSVIGFEWLMRRRVHA